MPWTAERIAGPTEPLRPEINYTGAEFGVNAHQGWRILLWERAKMYGAEICHLPEDF